MHLRYITGAFTYGMCRTSWYTWNQNTYEYDEKYKRIERKLLHTEIFGLSMINGFIAVGLLPIFLWEDACNLERHVRKIPIQSRSQTVIGWLQR